MLISFYEVRNMAITTISSKYQIVIPKEIRERLKLKPGQKIGILMKGKQAVLVPVRPIEELRGIAEGASMEGYREEVDRY